MILSPDPKEGRAVSTVNPNDPFEQNSSQGTVADGEPAAKKSGHRLLLWVIGIFGGLVFLAVLGCCGGGYFLLNYLTGEYQRQLTGNPVIVEHLGEIESMGMNLTKTAEAAENSDGNSFAFDIQGSLASGTILIKQDPSGDGTGIESAVLILSDGSRHQVPLGGSGPEEADFEFEIDSGEIDHGLEATDQGVPQP
jgi:hypothetical protein